MNDYNRWFKRIRLALEMQRDDVVECCRMGGLTISRSRAEGWQRGEQDTRRHVRMSHDEFDAFTRGLPDWSARLEG